MILIPTANPIPFTLSGVNEPAAERAPYREYYQKFRRDDITKIQILVPAADAAKDWGITAVNEWEVVMPYAFPKQTNDVEIAEYQVQEFTIDFSQFVDGKYRLALGSSGPVKYYSDFICVKDEQPCTRLLSYRNSYNAQSVAFGTGIVFHLRVEYGEYKGLMPKSEDAIFVWTEGAYKTLSSNPWNNKRIFIGGHTSGIPDWLMRIVNQVFSCDTLYIDNERYTKAEGSEFEGLEAEGTNLRSWSIEVGKVSNSLVYEEEAIITVNGVQEFVINAPETGYSETVTVFCHTDWEVVNDYPNWLTVAPGSGGKDGVEVVISVVENTSTARRSFSLSFRPNNQPGMIATVRVEQAGLLVLESYVVYPGDEKRYRVRELADGNLWTVENHASSVYADGSEIAAFTGGSTAQVKVDRTQPAEYGNWYNWFVTQQANLLPQGWEAPNAGQLDNLRAILGKNGLLDPERFNFKLSGFCEFDGSIFEQGINGWYWSNEQADDSNAHILGIAYGAAEMNIGLKEGGFSLRFLINDASLLNPDPYVIYPGDNMIYRVRKMPDGRWWTIDNHDSKVYADGSPIDSWAGGGTAQYSENTKDVYGKLYTWLVTQQANLCPPGWAVPVKDNFVALDIALGGTGENRRDDVTFAKYTDTSIWSGKIGGRIENIGILYQGVYAYYLSKSESSNDDNTCSVLILGNRYKEINPNGINDKKHGLSLRFIIEDENLILGK